MPPAYWWDKTWSLVEGCTKVSPGCTNCGAEERFARFGGRGKPYQGPIMEVKEDGTARWSGAVQLRELWDVPGRLLQPCRIFVAGMGDLFHESVPDAFVATAFSVMEKVDRHQYLVLTKRIDRAAAFVNARGGVKRHVLMGVSVEDQPRTDERLPLLCTVENAARWANCEPLLGPVNLGPYLDQLSWVSWGPEEQGPDLVSRPMDIVWARSLRDQCLEANVPFYAKDHDIDGVEYANRLALPQPIHAN